MRINSTNLYITCTFNTLLLILIFTFLGYTKHCFADCSFYVVNNANIEVYVQVGFYKSIAKPVVFKVNHASNNTATIKSAETCTSTDDSGLGLAYINLVNHEGSKDKMATGGWIYSPRSNAIYAIGQSLYGSEGALGASTNGTTLVLLNNYKPNQQSFEVVIKQASRNLSKPASMN